MFTLFPLFVFVFGRGPANQSTLHWNVFPEWHFKRALSTNSARLLVICLSIIEIRRIGSAHHNPWLEMGMWEIET